ncbi:glutamate racemase [Solimonas marina]|uniref:Glutamate racemase n=1 Tax=Solimonas marina TaxID=2714601 RepID=A0A969WE51_9GAMM|nr:glutamate racemase [Solimonas marina]NKF24430.1 glutamate racemase [Solimonas marina]
MSKAAPIGIFDSGVGGLSVLGEIRRLLPHEPLLYYADSAYCPYGARTTDELVTRATAITDELLAAGCKLIVVACNTATIAAIERLRATYPLSFVGIEPAIKPAVAHTRSGVVGVLATGAALAGEKFLRLHAQHRGDVRVVTQPCPGLVEFVERGELDSPQLRRLLAQYLEPLLQSGADTLVLGCTHYPFLRPVIAQLVGPGVCLLDTGAAVARQTQRVLEREALLAPPTQSGQFEWRTSGERGAVTPVVERLFRMSEGR